MGRLLLLLGALAPARQARCDTALPLHMPIDSYYPTATTATTSSSATCSAVSHRRRRCTCTRDGVQWW